MAFEDVKKVWMNGVLVDFDDAKIHVLTHVVHYGSSLFEGTRCYNTKRGPMVFRLPEHTRRLFDSCKIYRIEIPYTQDDINEAVLATIRANEFDACYIRPVVYRGFNTLGVNPFPCPVDVAIGVWKWGKYLGAEALERGVDVKVSSWTRMAPNTHPAIAKASANYMNSQLIKMEALVDGYSEGIGLDIRGFVSEGSGENIFLVRDGRILTPSMSSSILPGITRDTVITLARSLGYTVEETTIPRESLYIADEVFFTGTAAEITPIRSVDKIVVGNGARGAVTQKLQEAFFRIVEEGVGDEWGWLTPVAGAAAQRPVMLKQVK